MNKFSNQIGITTNCSQADTLIETLPYIKSAGFSSIMLDRYRNLGDDITTAQKIGLNVETVHLDSRRVNDLWEDHNTALPLIKQLTNDFKVLSSHGISTAIIHPAQNNSDFTTPANPPQFHSITKLAGSLSTSRKAPYHSRNRKCRPNALTTLVFYFR